MDYKQKYLKYKQKYLNFLKDQKGGEPFLMDILAGQVFSYLFERNQRQLQFIYTRRLPFMMQPLGNFTLNPRYRLKLLGGSGLSVMLATRLIEGLQNNRLKLAKRILSHTHELPKISPPTLAATATTFDRRWNTHSSSLASVVFHPILPILVTGSRWNRVKLWRLVNTPNSQWVVINLEMETSWGCSTDVLSVAFHGTAPLFATGSSDLTVQLWSFSSNGSKATCMTTLDSSNNGHSDWVWSVAFHSTLPLLASGSSDGITKLWRLDNPNGSAATCMATLDSSNDGHTHIVNSVVFHPTLPLLATGSDDMNVKLWRLDKSDGSMWGATCVTTLDRSKGGHSSSVYSIAFHPTLPILATSSYDKTVKLWRLVYTPDGSISAATCVATLDSSNGGHSSSVSSVAFHPTLPFLVTGSDDKTAKLWRLDNPDGSATTCVATLEGHNDSIRSVTFHQRLPFLVTVSDDNSVKLWKL
jgi:WD40 repeat protein